MGQRHIRILFALIIVFGLIVTRAHSPFAKEAKKVAILPFTIHADRDLTFLQEGIMDMLSSRLAWKGEVDVLEKGPVKKRAAQFKGPIDTENALNIGKAIQVDYVIFGSLTVFGESVSIDAKILDMAKSEELVTAFNQSKGMDEVIPTITRFARDINEKIMGRFIVKPPVRTAAPEATKGLGGLTRAEGGFGGEGVRHVQRFQVGITGLDGGDVNGDGKNELVFIDNTKVFVYKWKNGTLALFKAVKGGRNHEQVWVSVADLDHNGRAEIYVSNLGESDVSSYVLEWDGNDFKKIAEKQRWFFRVIDIPDKGQSLIGQRRETGGAFRGKVKFLKRDGNGYVGTEPITLPRFGNIFNFVIADLAGGGGRQTVLLGPSEYLRVYDPGNEEIWKSEEYYGGSITLMEIIEEDSVTFFPSPIFITDVDDDGQKEVMICRNKSSVGRILMRTRAFSSGALHFLTGNKTGLSLKWKSKKQSGPIVAYKVFDVDNDGRQELFIASSVGKQKKWMFKLRSQVVIYDLK